MFQQLGPILSQTKTYTIMNKAEAKILTDDYINYNHPQSGNCPHFDIDGERIRGYVFTRGELSPLLGDNKTKHLFLMLALSPDAANPTAKFLNLIIAGVAKGGTVGTYNIDESAFLVTSSPVLTFSAAPLQTIKNNLKSIKSIFRGFGNKNNDEKQPDIEFINAHSEFAIFGNGAHLYKAVEEKMEKIKGFHFGEKHHSDTDGSTYLKDLKDLGLIDPPTGAQDTDQFIFMPIIRKKNPDDTAYNPHYLSIAVSRFIDGSDSGDKYEYCLPCPSACPKNYPLT